MKDITRCKIFSFTGDNLHSRSGFQISFTGAGLNFKSRFFKKKTWQNIYYTVNWLFKKNTFHLRNSTSHIKHRAHSDSAAIAHSDSSAIAHSDSAVIAHGDSAAIAHSDSADNIAHSDSAAISHSDSAAIAQCTLHIAQSHSFICTQAVGDLAGIVTGGVLHSGAGAGAARVMGHLEHLHSSQELGVRSWGLGVWS